MAKNGTSFKKGDTRTGRKRGVQNKATREAKDLFAELLQFAAELDPVKKKTRAIFWLEQTAARNPAQALALLAQLSEFTVPKLTRAEMKTENATTITVRFQ